MRRTFIVILLLAILGGTAWSLLNWNGAGHARTDPWLAVPVNAAIIIEVPLPLAAWERFTSTSRFWNAWEKYPGCVAVDSLMAHLRDVCENDASLKKAIDASTMLITIPSSGDGSSALITWSIQDRGALRKLDRAFAISPGDRSPFARNTSLPPMERAYVNGLLLISDSRELMDDAITRLSISNMDADSALIAARSTLGAGSDAHVLINISRTRRWLNNWLQPDAFFAIEQVDGWAALDMKLRPDAVLMSGLLIPTEVTNELVAIDHQSMGKGSLARVLPANVCWMTTSEVDDPARYVNDLIGHPPNDSLMNAYSAWVHGSMGQALTMPDDTTAHRWAVFQAEDPARAIDALNARCAHGCDTIAYRGVRLSRSVDVGALAAVFGSAFDAFERPWWCVLGDKVIFSEQIPALREAIDAWSDGSSLAQDPRTSGFFQRYASEAGFTCWSDGARGSNVLRGMANDRGRVALDSYHDGWHAFGDAMMQLSPDRDGTFQITCCIGQANPSTGQAGASPHQQDADELWSVAIGAAIERGPFLLTDHLSRTKQVVVQDLKHRITLIGCTGKVLWQRELEAPIIGAPHQVDALKNGKLQMLFNTDQRVYLIDRNGKDVAGFPISLPEKASAPLSVFDYDRTREYRVLVPTVEARVLNFGINGKAVQGWDPPRTSATCSVAIEHLRSKNKDYLFMLDNGGSISVLDRKGAKRYAPKLKIDRGAEPIALRTAMDIGDYRVLWKDSLGNVWSGSLDGVRDTILLAENGSNVMIIDEDRDGVMDVVRIVHGERSVIDGAKPFTTGSDGPHDVPRFIVADINLDGSKETVTVEPDGRIIVTRIDRP